MANSQQGKVPIEIDGKTYTLSLSIDAMCQIEDAESAGGPRVSFQDVIQRVNHGEIRAARRLFWGALRDFHEDVTLKDAGALLTHVGMSAVTHQLTAVLGATTPDKEDVQATGARPPKAPGRKAGTGRNSSVTAAPLA